MGFFVFGLFSGGYKVVAVPLGISHEKNSWAQHINHRLGQKPESSSRGGGAKFLGGNMKLAKINLLIYHTEEEELGNLM